MWAFFWFLITSIAAAILQKAPPGAKPPGAGDFQVPTAEEGRPIPLCYGTAQVGGPNVTWWGDLNISAITQSVGGFFGIGAKSVVTGYQYYIGMMMALCAGPVDAIIGIKVGDKVMPFASNITQADGHQRIWINQPECFGGTKQEGGILGHVNFYYGDQNQTANSYLAGKFGGTAPGWRGLCYAVLEGGGAWFLPGGLGFYVGTTQYIKNWAFIIQRCPTPSGMDSSKAKIAVPVTTAFVGTGSGTLSGVSAGGSAVTETITLKATDATHFSVTGSISGSIGTATVGTPFASTRVNFTINAGSTAFVAGDKFQIGIDTGFDANPAYILMDLMMDANAGLAIPITLFDTASFQAAANTLYSEGMGLSLFLDSQNTADTVIQEIIKTCDLVIYTDPSTGLWTLKLVRADYDPATLTEFTIADTVATPQWHRASWPETINEVKVEYVDRAANFTARIAQAQESANYSVQGALNSVKLDFHGLTNATTGGKVAMRVLKSVSYPLAQFTLKFNRKAWNLRPGSVFKLTWQPPSGPAFVGMVLRVNSIRYGTMDGGEIEVEAVEDIFSVANTAYPPPGPGGWDDPLAPAAAVVAQKLIELPYWIVAQNRYVGAMASRGDTTTFRAQIWTNAGGSYGETNGLEAMTPSGLLASTYSYRTAATDATGFTIAAGGTDIAKMVDLSTDSGGLGRGDNLAYFEDTGEIVAWQTCTDNGDGTFTFAPILRGLFDTVPATHASGGRVWFMSAGIAATQPSAFAADQTVQVKILPHNPLGTLPIAAATAVSFTTASRAWQPYPPGNVKVNTLDYSAWPTTTIGDNALTWAHRNRVSEGSGLLPTLQSDPSGSFTPEGTVTVEVYVGGTLKQSYTALSGTAQTYTAAQRIIDDTDGTKTVTFKFRPINGSFEGTSRTTAPLTMTGLGMTLGLYLGGIQA